MEAPLARDEDGNPFELPEEAVFWRVRRVTTGRPKTVLGRDGEPLYIPVAAGATALEDNGCEPDRYRLEASDANRQPIPEVPIAVVVLAGGGEIERAPAQTALVPAFVEPARNATEALTRTVEAMQRAQLERERQQAERERWQTSALVESNRSIALICTSLIERLKPASSPSASDPLAILKKQAEAEDVMDRLAARRNGGLLPGAPIIKDDDDEEHKGLTTMDAITQMVTNIVQPMKPAINQYLHAQSYKAMGFKPEEIEERLKADARNGAGLTDSDDEDEDGQTIALVQYPRSMRQVLAEVSDEETTALNRMFYQTDDEEAKALFAKAEQIADLAERVAWARTLIRERNAGVPQAPAEAASPDSIPSSIPSQFRPLYLKLTPSERESAERMLSKLDLSTLAEIGDSFLVLSPEAQLDKVRKMIQTFEQREASSAQRAVQAVLQGAA